MRALSFVPMGKEYGILSGGRRRAAAHVGSPDSFVQAVREMDMLMQWNGSMYICSKEMEIPSTWQECLEDSG